MWQSDHQPSVDTNHSLSDTATADSIMLADDNQSEDRCVTIKRQPGGGLGITVKGGAEHGIPVLISRVFPGQAADQTHLLHPGDAIITVNGKKVDHMMHDDVVAELRSCGAQVSLTVRPFDKASQVLRLSSSSSPTGKDFKKSKQTFSLPDNVAKGAPLTEKQSKARLGSAEVPSSATEVGRKSSKEVPGLNTSTHLESPPSWRGELAIPLLQARVERYHPGTDREREKSFELVSGKGGLRSGLVECSDAGERNSWVDAISNAIHDANMGKVESMKDDVTGDDVAHMGWVSERTTSQLWKPCFVVLSGCNIFLFDSPPTTREEWGSCRRIYKLYECLCRVHPVSKLLDGRKFCFSIQHGAEAPIYSSVPTQGDLERWEKSLQKSTHQAVFALKSNSYSCFYNELACDLTVHFNDGMKLIDAGTQEMIWSYKFSQLKGSSDDGGRLITFTFHNRLTDQIDKQSFTCASAYPLLFCVHAFLAAKLSLVDPAFLDKVNAQNATSRQLHDATSRVINGTPAPKDM